jgi:hypothetical protein
MICIGADRIHYAQAEFSLEAVSNSQHSYSEPREELLRIQESTIQKFKEMDAAVR